MEGIYIPKDEKPQVFVDEYVRLLKEDTEEPNLTHGKPLELPPWYDQDKFKRGQKFFRDNYYALFVSKLSGLLVILSIPRVLRILIMTKQSSEPKTAFKRYLSTLQHMLMWYNGDVTDKNSWAFKSLSEVHAKHAAANRRGIKEKAGSLSQSSLAITQFGFMGFGLLFPEKLGIKINDPQDLEGFVHFWRTIGYLMGVEDRFNICRDTVEETKIVCQRILDDILKPILELPSKDFIEMTTYVLQGMWVVIPVIDVEAFMTFTYHLAGLTLAPFTNWYSSSMYNLQVFVHQTLLASRIFGAWMRTFFNFHLWFSLLIAAKFPLLGYISYGIPLGSSKNIRN